MVNYFRRDGERWGFNVTRMQRRTDVTSFWSYSATEMYKPRHFGISPGSTQGQPVQSQLGVHAYASARVDFNGTTEVVPKGAPT